MSKIFSLCQLSCAWHGRLEETGTYLLSAGCENVPGEGNRLGWLWSYSQGKSQTKSEYAAAAGIYPNGVCSTDLRLDTSTNGLKQVYTSPQAFY
jgi:hypothetical protein